MSVKGQRKLSYEEQKYIRENCKNKTIPEIAKDLSRQYETIRHYIKDNGLTYKKVKKVRTKDVNELSIKEKEILELLATGKSNKEIAKKMFIGITTVKTHLQNIYQKLNLSGNGTRESSTLRVRATLYFLHKESETK